MYNRVASTLISSIGTFVFDHVVNGTYLLKAEVIDRTVNPDLLNTYYESSSSIYTASQLIILTPGTKPVQINMVLNTLPAGYYKITGKVVTKTGTPESQPEVPVGIPASGVDMVLKQNGVVVANATTGADGVYVFSNLPTGEYEVFVEKAGYTQIVSQKVNLSAVNPVKDKIDFTIWTDLGTHIITNINTFKDDIVVTLYPNPTTGLVKIHLDRKDIREVEITVYNSSGTQVFRNQYWTDKLINFDLSGKVSGIYLVKIQSEGQTVIKKLILDKR